MSVDLACNYASLILYDDKQDIKADKLVALTKAAGVTVPAYVAQLYVDTLAKKKMETLLTVSSAPVASSAPVTATATTTTTAPD
ncbi:hypothetical protein DLAC_09758 [Tieghemostelium lacteum]|uniref:Uncharacterized protein n=1 Tax=Tieghemostelium lacteum TaxID=361077 RepID=A0A151Z747_TIELA|nr:hypothetical protein DLAC_09758 [Tieghemostelium lacteum]|eukprot:KYQ89791.1 hypothetical protein DLAC_09758 [Tieghemostelium lacteum]